VDDACRERHRDREGLHPGQWQSGETTGIPAGPGSPDVWRNSVLIPCRDGKARRVEPSLECLVDGVPFRLADGRTREGTSRSAILKGFGNAIVPQVAAVFIRAFIEAREMMGS
jgi:DNA (cytosine-5)-methyltransferase 1